MFSRIRWNLPSRAFWRWLSHITFQALGAIFAAFTLRLFFLNRPVMLADLGSTELAIGVTPIYGVFLEAIGTFLFCLAALVAAFYVRQPGRQAALVGGTLFLLILLLGHLTGASFNPARSIGPALSSGHWSNIIVHLVGRWERYLPQYRSGCYASKTRSDANPTFP